MICKGGNGSASAVTGSEGWMLKVSVPAIEAFEGSLRADAPLPRDHPLTHRRMAPERPGAGEGPRGVQERALVHPDFREARGRFQLRRRGKRPYSRLCRGCAAGEADRWMDAMANLQEADTHQLGGRDVHSDVWRFLGVLDDCSSFMGPDKSKRPVTRLSCKAALTGSELPTPCLRQRRGSALR
jgi:hypothetical protein